MVTILREATGWKEIIVVDHTNPETDFFGPPIYAYTRKQALADGVQTQVPPSIATEAGFKIPVFLTDTVFAECVKVPDDVTCQDEDGRLWDILTMLHHAIRNSPAGDPNH